MIRRLAALLIAALAPFAAHAQPVAVTLHNDRLFVTATIAGHETEAVLDSAAEVTLVDRAYAREIGIAPERDDEVQGSGGSQKVQFASGVTLRLAGASFTPEAVAIADLSDISKRLNGGAPIRLIVGREFFDAGRWTIDLAAGTLDRADPSATPPGIALELVTTRGIEAMPASIEGLPSVRAVFDLGNGTGVLVGKAYADRIGLLRDGRPQRRAEGGGLGGARERTMVTLNRLTLAGRTFTGIPAAIDETPTAEDLNIGTAILRNFRITVDYPAHRLWLDPLR